MQTFACRLPVISSASRQSSSLWLTTAERSPPIAAHGVIWVIPDWEAEQGLGEGWRCFHRWVGVSTGLGNTVLSLSPLLMFKLQNHLSIVLSLLSFQNPIRNRQDVNAAGV